MEEASKLVYVVVVVDDEDEEKGDVDPVEASSYRYTRLALQNTLQLMGCKPRHAFKVLRRERDEDATVTETSKSDTSRGYTDQQKSPLKILERSNSSYFALYKRLTTVVVLKEKFLNVVCDALSQYKYVGPYQREDLVLACRIKERKESVTILLCGTSGCGKSTLSALLGSRLGITTVISTDSIRHMMRSFVDENQNPLLWSSTYHAGEHLDPVAVAKAKDGRRAEKRSGVSPLQSNVELSDEVSNEKSGAGPPQAGLNKTLIGQKQMAIEGYKAQSEMVIDSLDRLITAWEDQKESVVVEGVHLSLNFVMDLMKKHPSIIPFMIYISNEDKHMERFAVRAKYMSLDPAKNKYVKYIRNIRAIQDYLCNRADKYLVPKINNTNVDRSVAAIHATVFSCLRRRNSGEHLYDHSTHTVPVVDEEYRRQRSANSLGSKGMLQLIQRQGSSRHMIAIFNVDGSVAKAWHMESSKCNGNSEPGSGNKKSLGNPLYGPLRIGKAEPVNLHFGNFGISAWPNDTGGTSHGGNNEDSRPDETETASRHSSCSSLPSVLGGPSKEIKEGSSVSGSDEATEDHHDSDEEFTDLDNTINDEIEGSVDEDSSESEEEYEDLAMHDDGLENGYQSDNDEPKKSVPERLIQPPPLIKRSLEN